MDTAQIEGSPAAVIRRGVVPPSVRRGTVATCRRAALAIETVDPGESWLAGEQVIILAGEDGARVVVRARFVSTQSGSAVFALEGEWRPFDAAAQRPSRPGVEAEVRSVLGQSRQPATIVEVSPGGMDVLVAVRPGGKELEVQARAGGFAAHLPCQVAGHSETEDGQVLLRLRFGPLSLPQQAFVRQLVTAVGATGSPDDDEDEG